MRTGKLEATLPTTDCVDHPAVAAWLAFSGKTAAPEHIDVLRSTIHRLAGAGPAGTSVIVQYCRMQKALIERTVYDEILPHVPVTAPRFYGLKRETSDFAWMFLEDVGDRRYSDADPVQRSLAGRWMGLLHSAASRLPAARSLPEAGPQRHLNYLVTARNDIRASLANPASLEAADIDLLQGIAGDLDAVECDWADVERICASVPSTLVHGDFCPRNAYVRHGRDGLAIFPIDWENAGWGTPAVDLFRIDLPEYVSIVHTCWWPDVCLEAVQRLATVGKLLRCLAAIFWQTRLKATAARCLKGQIPALRVLRTRLTEAVLELRRTTRLGVREV